jgi:hypothetical protein
MELSSMIEELGSTTDGYLTGIWTCLIYAADMLLELAAKVLVNLQRFLETTVNNDQDNYNDLNIIEK